MNGYIHHTLNMGMIYMLMEYMNGVVFQTPSAPDHCAKFDFK